MFSAWHHVTGYVQARSYLLMHSDASWESEGWWDVMLDKRGSEPGCPTFSASAPWGRFHWNEWAAVLRKCGSDWNVKRIQHALRFFKVFVRTQWLHNLQQKFGSKYLQEYKLSRGKGKLCGEGWLSYFEGFSGRGKIKQMQMIHFLYDINSKGGWIPFPISQRDAWVTLLPLWSSHLHVTAGNDELQREGRQFKASSTGWLPPWLPQCSTASSS